MQRAALYARVSTTDDADDRTDRQLARLRTFAREAGYEVAAEFEDDGVSAFKSGVRPAYASLLAGLGDGRFDVVCAVSLDRITRRSMELEALKLAAVKAKAVLHTINGGLFDPSQGLSSAMLTMMGAVGELESAEKSNRTRAARDNLARQGIPGPAPRRFGYESDGMTPREDEADRIRAAYDTILNRGGSYYSIAQAWSQAGVTRRSGRADWSAERVREVLTRPAVAGVLVVKGERQPVSQIVPIVGEAEWLEMSGRTQARGKVGSRPKHPLSGIITCPCGSPLIVSKRSGRAIYRCKASMKGTAGEHVSQRTDWVEDEALSGLWEVLTNNEFDTPEERQALRDALARQADLGRRKAHATTLLLDPDADQATVRATLRDLTRDLDAVDAEVHRMQSADTDAAIVDAARIARHVKRRGMYWHPAFAEQTLPNESIYEAQERRFREAFAVLTIDEQRALFRGVATVSLGTGRGRGRVRVEART